VQTYRFLPRYKRLAQVSVGLGIPIAALGAIAAVAVPIVAGALGIVAGAAYLASPAWRLEIAVDDDGVEVRSPARSRFKLAWRDVVKVIASPTTHTCFVDGGSPDKSFVVPGVGAPAPYDIAGKAELYDAIVAKVARDKIQEVERLELAKTPA
jgi:hypothetical protein